MSRFYLAAAVAVLAFVPSAIAQNVQVRIELVDVWCDNTEDNAGEDEFFVASALKRGSEVKVAATKPLDINNGQTKKFPVDEVIVFDAAVPAGETIVGGLTAWDQDVASDRDQKGRQMTEDIRDSVDAIGVAANAGDITKAISQSVFTLVNIIAKSDPDDKLGEKELTIPATGPADETLTWDIEKKKLGNLGYKYKVRYRIIRQ